MAIIATNTSNLTIVEKLSKGQDIITKSTANQAVPDNTEPLAAFSAAQTALETANAQWIAHRQEAGRLVTVRKQALKQWQLELGLLASATQSITKGVPEKIQSAGFDVRSPAMPTQPVVQIEGLKVRFNGIEGHSDISWAADDNADSYVLESSPDPIGANTFKYVATVAEAFYTGNGATPGVRCWYRVAGVNRLGQGPWSEPALRPVM